MLPRDQICVSRASRLNLLSLSISRLSTEYPELAGQLAEWCSQISKHKEIGSPFNEHFYAVLKVFRYSTNWHEASMWGKIMIEKK